jgi:hypothetical protein
MKKIMTFDEALESHSMIQDAGAWLRYGQEPEAVFSALQNNRGLVEERDEATTLDLLRQAWEGLTGDANATGPLADAIAATIPTHLIMSIRAPHGISTAFALFHIAKETHKLGDMSDGHKVRKACARAFEEYENREIEANDVQEGFGWDHSPAWKTLREHRFDKDGTAYIQKIAKLAGKMFEAMKYHGTPVPTKDPDEVVGVKQGDEASKLLRTEVAAMSEDGVQGDLKTLDFFDQRTVQYDEAGEKMKSRGPMVIALDESGSMHDHDVWGHHQKEAGRNTWAKACALALTRIAHAEGRKVVYVHFSTGIEVSDIDEKDPAGMWDALLHFLNGGTNIPLALEASLRQVHDLDKRGFKGADIVFVSDGQDWDTDAQKSAIKKMKKDGVDLWSVAIGPDWDHSMPLRKHASEFVHVSDADLGNPDAVAVLKASAMNNSSRSPSDVDPDDDLDLN